LTNCGILSFLFNYKAGLQKTASDIDCGSGFQPRDQMSRLKAAPTVNLTKAEVSWKNWAVNPNPDKQEKLPQRRKDTKGYRWLIILFVP
jgi:hypothetical protein